MNSYIVEGGRKLIGEVEISGSKNAALPVIAAAILNKGVSTIKNVPDIRDVKIMCQILEKLGCKIKREGNTLEINATDITNTEIPSDLMHEMRSSVIIAGALIGRMKECKFTYPGGCEIGARPINMHLEAFKQLGVLIKEDNGFINCTVPKSIPNEIVLDFPSVGATENIMLASSQIDGTTYIKNVAREPEIRNLQDFLNSLGGKITGAGSNTIVVKGVPSFHDTEFSIIPDRIEAGTYLCMVATTGGEIELTNVNPEHLSAVLNKLRQINCRVNASPKTIHLKANHRLISTNIKTTPYPGFPTDMQSQFVTTLSLAEGTSIVVENIFENRFKYVNELLKMGAKITIEGKAAIIQGVTKLSPANIEAKELRGGAALVIAALCAEGSSKITGTQFIERGYENLIKKLKNMGAKIKNA